MGALGVARLGNPYALVNVSDPLMDDVYCRVLEATKFDGAKWNDAPGRTKEEVIDLLESLALQLEIEALAAA